VPLQVVCQPVLSLPPPSLSRMLSTQVRGTTTYTGSTCALPVYSFWRWACIPSVTVVCVVLGCSLGNCRGAPCQTRALCLECVPVCVCLCMSVVVVQRAEAGGGSGGDEQARLAGRCFLRPGRIDRMLYIGPPDDASRRQILELQVQALAACLSCRCIGVLIITWLF
jgi:hypothetical protein